MPPRGGGGALGSKGYCGVFSSCMHLKSYDIAPQRNQKVVLALQGEGTKRLASKMGGKEMDRRGLSDRVFVPLPPATNSVGPVLWLEKLWFGGGVHMHDYFSGCGLLGSECARLSYQRTSWTARSYTGKDDVVSVVCLFAQI